MSRDDLSVDVHFSPEKLIEWFVYLISDTGHYTCKAAFVVCGEVKTKSNNSVRSRRNAADDQRGGRVSSKGYALTLCRCVWFLTHRCPRPLKKSSPCHESNIKGRNYLQAVGVEEGRMIQQVLVQVRAFTFSLKYFIVINQA